jgi:hypothetical protein
MDFWKTMGVLLKRWYVSVPVFVVSLALAGAVFVSVSTQYESTGTIVLTAPTSGGVTSVNPATATGPGNPLLDFEGSLTITTQLLIQSLSSPTVQNQIAAQGGASTFQAGDGLTGGPFVVIVADATSTTQAQRTVTLALQYAESELNARQKNLNAPPSTYIGTQIVVAPTPATTKIGSKVRAGGVTLALGLVLSLAAAFAIESRRNNRRRRRDEEPRDLDDDQLLDEDEVDDDVDDLPPGDAVATHKMRPAPPPRSIPQPVRTGGPRPAPRPQVGPIGDRANPRREPFAPSPMHKPHPAKPRVLPAPGAPQHSQAPAQNGPANANGTPANANGVTVTNALPAANSKPVPNGTPVTNGKPAVNGNSNSHDWPRTDFRSPDSSAG